MGVYDQSARHAAQADLTPVLRRLLRGGKASLQYSHWVDSRTTPLPGERDLTADRVAVLTDAANPAQPWLLLMEFQAQHDLDKLDVTLAEVGRLRCEVRHGDDRKGKYQVVAAFVYLVGQCPAWVLDMTVDGQRGTRHETLCWNVAEESAEAALEALAAGEESWGLLYWIPLMQGGSEPSVIARWRDLVSALPEARQRANLARIALVFAELAGCYLAWEKGLEDWDMTESPVVNRWIEKAEQDTELRTTRRNLLRMLNRRFPGAVTEDVNTCINQQDSMSMLNDWLDAGATATTWEQFVAVLRR